MAQVDIHGTRLEVFDEGQGETLVLVHGSASDHRTWQGQRGPFSERFRVLTYSRRYHWPNEPIRDGLDYVMAKHVDDLESVLCSLEAAPAHLVGHSYGAFLCLLLALREPRLVRTLVLAEPPAITLFVSDPPKPFELLRLLTTRPRTAAALVQFGARGVAPAKRAFREGDMEKGVRIFGDAVFGRGGYRRFPESRRQQVLSNLTNIKAELLGSGLALLGSEEVRGIEAPTLLVTGQRSLGLFRRLTDLLEELLPASERIEIPGGSHAMHEDNAAAYNAAVLSFLTGRRSAG